RIAGRHRRVGKLSEKVQQQMIKAGIMRSRFELFTTDPAEEEAEVYEFHEYAFSH
ncbi:unnamed protein product, partial [marine sediment metagenome]